jgi:prepilin-type N-terminal cleavage/methylation domain-containing protein
MNKNIKGFTLIELIVVVAIIAMLTSVVLSSMSTSRNKALDTASINSVREIKTALTMYFADYGVYPTNLQTLTTGSKIYIAEINPNVKYVSLTYRTPATPPQATFYNNSCIDKCNYYVLATPLKLRNDILNNSALINVVDKLNTATNDCIGPAGDNIRCYAVTP